MEKRRVGRSDGLRAPLLQLTGASTHDELHTLIEHSDRRRRLETEALDAQKSVEAHGDGLTLDALDAELAATDAQALEDGAPVR